MSFVKYFVIQFWKVMPKSYVWMSAETWSCSLLKVLCCQAKKQTPDLPCCFSPCALPKPLVFSMNVNPYVIQWDTCVSQFLGLGPNDDEVLVTTQSMPVCATKTCELDWRAWISQHIGARKQRVCKKMCGHSQRCLTVPFCKIGSGFPPAVEKCLCVYKSDSRLQYLQIIYFYCGLFILISYNML